MTGARSLSVQSVLYLTPAESVSRLSRSVANAARLAQESGHLASWELAVGDSSPEAMLTPAGVTELDALCTAAGGSFRYDFFGENLGHGGGHNRLASDGTSDLLLFLNPDALLAADALAHLALGLTESVGVVDALQVPLEHAKDYDAKSGDSNWCAGACMMTRRTIFELVGRFDSDSFFMYCDDVDYSWRVRLASFRAVYVPAARVFHDKRLTADGEYLPTEAEVHFSAQAALLLAHKYSRPSLVRSLSRRLRRYGSDSALMALAEFRSRKTSGRLAQQIDRAHQVASFVGQGYGTRRF